MKLRAIIKTDQVTESSVTDVIDSFHQQHQLDYGYAFLDGEVELITLRVIGVQYVTPLQGPALGEVREEFSEGCDFI